MCYTIVESTKATVNNVPAVQNILNNYWHHFHTTVVPDGGGRTGTLALSGYDALPLALPVSLWPDPEEYPNDHAWENIMEFGLQEIGDVGFVAMLERIAPYLETPLTVVWHRKVEGQFGLAGQWTVYPGAPNVQVQEVFPLARN